MLLHLFQDVFEFGQIFGVPDFLHHNVLDLLNAFSESLEERMDIVLQVLGDCFRGDSLEPSDVLHVLLVLCVEECLQVLDDD